MGTSDERDSVTSFNESRHVFNFWTIFDPVEPELRQLGDREDEVGPQGVDHDKDDLTDGSGRPSLTAHKR